MALQALTAQIPDTDDRGWRLAAREEVKPDGERYMRYTKIATHRTQ